MAEKDNKPKRPQSENSPGEGTPTRASAPDFSRDGIGAYGEHSAELADLSAKSWDNGRKALNETPAGRLAIRTFSRGIMGAAFFTAGNMLTRKWMHSDGGVRYDHRKGFSEQENPLQFIAKLIDTTIGKPIEWTVEKVTGDHNLALRSVRFRPTKFRGDADALYHKGTFYPGSNRRGRSLGNEAVNITFDFFCASVGDAWGRDIAGWIDPEVKKKWLDEDGHINVPEAVKSSLKAMTRYITYNGGEDWAVAIPYAYYMKGQRLLIDKMSPGFKYDFDRSLNGASFKMNDKHQIIGNFNAEGMLDLQGRFTVYNIGTLMYRELYDYAANRLEGKQASLYGAPDKPDQPRSLLDLAGNGLKWIARSVVKGSIYMTPAVPFFWITRSTQGKHSGAFIHQDRVKGVSRGIFSREYLAYPRNKADVIRANEYVGSGEETFWGRYSSRTGKWLRSGIDHGTTNIKEAASPTTRAGVSPTGGTLFDPYESSFSLPDAATNAIGQFNYDAARSFDGIAEQMDRFTPLQPAKKLLGIEGKSFQGFTRNYVNAAFSYTPYMYAKAEASRLWDNGKMDMSIERMIDGAARFNLGEFKAGAGEVGRSILHKDLADPAREREAQRRLEMDTSPPVDISRDSEEESSKKLRWQDRVISGKSKAEKPRKERGAKFADQEELRQALKDLEPPSNSVH